jgi:hypothetical protein
MRLIVAGGGTGGHLFPGIAVATAMRERIASTRVLFIGTSRLLDQQALAGLGFELAALECGGVKGLGLSGRLRSLFLMPGALLASLRMLKRFKPDLVFGVGGYVTGPVLLAAKLCACPSPFMNRIRCRAWPIEWRGSWRTGSLFPCRASRLFLRLRPCRPVIRCGGKFWTWPVGKSRPPTSRPCWSSAAVRGHTGSMC